MIYHEALNSLVEIQKRVHKAITKIKEPILNPLDEISGVKKEMPGVKKEMPGPGYDINAKRLKSNTDVKKMNTKNSDLFENPSVLKFLRAYKKEEEIETTLKMLLKDLDEQVDVVFAECKEFDSLVALTGLRAKNEKLSRKLVDAGYCFCNKSEDADMIACDDKNCSIEWFHLKCVGLTEIPEGKWFCDNCKASKEKEKKF
ncbi:Transcriptional regulatory protein PHO23 [Dictyocoela roeselum]|nr:Transcriptional regulatory protein PHO23 [Dictyocoela roeselum]